MLYIIADGKKIGDYIIMKKDCALEYGYPDEFFVVWTPLGYYIAQFDSRTKDTIALHAVYKLVTGSMIPVRCCDVMIMKREDVFLLFQIKGD